MHRSFAGSLQRTVTLRHCNLAKKRPQQPAVLQAARRAAASAPSRAKVATVETLEWRAPLQVLRYPDPRLFASNARLGAGTHGAAVRALAEEMFKVMYQDDGVGLAAPQVGVNVRLMVFNETAQPGAPEETILVNPEIVAKSSRTDKGEEGCLSFPRIYGDVERHVAIRVKALDADGNAIEREYTGFPAVIFQHEFDHLNGTLFHTRMKPSELEKIRPSLVNLEEEYMAANPGVMVQRLAPPKVNKGFGKKL